MEYKYIYIFRSKAKRRIKIGISKDVDDRLKDIRYNLAPDAKLIAKFKIFWARHHEGRLHKRYKKWHAPLPKPKGKNPSGRNEWFRLHPIWAYSRLWALWIIQYGFIFLLLFLIILLIVIL